MKRLTRSNAWLVFGVAALGGIVAEQAVSTPIRHYIVYMTFDIVALAAMAYGIRINRPSDRRPWQWILANQAIFFLADAVFYTRHDVLHINDFPTPADPLYMAHYASLFIGLILLVRRRSGGTHDHPAVIDAAVAAIAAGLFSWLMWVGPTLGTPMPLLTRFVIAVYPVIDVALLAVSLRLVSGRGARPMSFWCLNGAFVALFAADGLLGWQQSRGTYVTHNLDDALWLGFAALMTMAALHPSMDLVAQAPAQPASRSGVRSLALFGAAVVPPLGLLLDLDTGRANELAIGLASIAMYSLVILRLHLAGREEARARRLVEVQRVELQGAFGLLRQATDARAQLLDGIVTARENERSWIAAELHDGPIQSLAAIGFGMDRVCRQFERAGGGGETLADMSSQRDALSEVISGVRRLMAELRPPALDESGLAGALEDYVAGFRQHGLACHADIRLDGMRVDDKSETILYRVTQEAFSNIRKHARATWCRLSLWPSATGVLLEIEDNGRGFDATRQIEFLADHHFGLSTMRERVEGAGGAWSLETSPAGTCIRAFLPAAVRAERLLEETVA